MQSCCLHEFLKQTFQWNYCSQDNWKPMPWRPQFYTSVLCLQKNVPMAFTGQLSRVPGSHRERKPEKPGLGDKMWILLINATCLHLVGEREKKKEKKKRKSSTGFSFDLWKYIYQVSAGTCIPYIGKWQNFTSSHYTHTASFIPHEMSLKLSIDCELLWTWKPFYRSNNTNHKKISTWYQSQKTVIRQMDDATA